MVWRPVRSQQTEGIDGARSCIEKGMNVSRHRKITCDSDTKDPKGADSLHSQRRGYLGPPSTTTRDKHLSGLCSVEPQIVVGGPVSDTIKLLLKCGPYASSNDEVSVVRKFEKVIF